MGPVVQVLYLVNKLLLVSEIEEVGADIGMPDCKLTNPIFLLKEKWSRG